MGNLQNQFSEKNKGRILRAMKTELGRNERVIMRVN